MRTWLLTIRDEHFHTLQARIVAKEFNLAMRRAAREVANAKAHLPDSQKWFVSELKEEL